MTSLLTNPHLRSWSRRLHLIRIFSTIHGWWKRLRGIDYEESFWLALRRNVRAGDTVWDVGANVGIYSTRLATLVGENGKVVAFEPFPATAESLKNATAAFGNVHVFNVGLGQESMWVEVPVGEHSEINSVFREASTASPAEKLVSLQIQQGDEILRSHPHLAPDLVKVDVEGYEEEVLAGLAETLETPRLRGVFIEVHFGELERKGQREAPQRICQMLTRSGFTVIWTDYSHIQATR